MSDIDRLSYVNYDFQDLVRQLQDRLRSRDAWKDTYISATGQTLIELYAYVLNLMLYYVERRAEEGYLATARNKSSIINLVQLINYEPKRNRSATGSVVFGIQSVAEGTIFIPRHTVVRTAAGVDFVTIEEGTIEAGKTTSNPIQVVQGTVERITTTSVGALNHEILINSTTVESDRHEEFSTINVYVGTRKWSKVDSFLRSGAADRHFVIRPNLDDTLSVVFGDNVRGAAPEGGRTIIIEYISSMGNAGNVYEENRITRVASPTVSYDYIEDNVPKTGTRTLSISSSTLMTGGADAETAEEIRQQAPDIFKTGDRLVVKEDFRAFLINTENIVEVNVWGENEEDPPNYDMFNRVKICLLLQEWHVPPQSTKDRLELMLYEKSLMTVKYEWVDAVILEIVPVLDVVVNRRFSLAVTQATIEAVLRDQFILGQTARFGESRRKSNLIERIDSLDSVSHLYLTLEIYQALIENDGIYSATLLSDSIKPGTVNLYIGNNLVAVDQDRETTDEIGDFVVVDDDYSVVGTVDYATGDVEVEVHPLEEGDVVSVRYQQDNEGDVVVGNNGICKFSFLDMKSIRY